MKRSLPANSALVLPTLIAAFIAAWTFSDFRYVGWFTDSLDYLWFADYYLQSFGGTPSAEAQETFRSTRFPPLLPLLLAAVGAGSASPLPMAALMFVAFVACTALATWWAFRNTDRVRPAMLCGLVLALSPGWFLVQQVAPVSEPIFLLLVLATLLLAQARPLTRSRALVLVLVAAAVPLSRTIGIALVIPVALLLASERGLGRLRWPLAALALAPCIAWMVFRATLPDAESYTNSLGIASIRDQFGSIGAWLLGQPLRMVEGAATSFAIAPGALTVSFTAALAALALLACIVEWRRLDSQFLLLYCAIVFVWPFPAELPRFMVLLLPIVCVRAAAGAALLARFRAPALAQDRAGLLAVIAVLAISLSAPGVLHTARSALRPVDAELEPFKRTVAYFMAPDIRTADLALEFGARVVGAMKVLPEYVAPGDCVYSVSAPMLRYYGRVESVAVPRGLDDPATAKRRLAACRYVFAISAPTSQYGEPAMYPMNLLADQAEPMFISFMVVDGARVPAVGLFDLGSSADAAQ